MNITISPRQSGKTTKMINLLKENRNRILLTFSNQEAERLKQLYPELKESIYYWGNWIKDQYGSGSNKEIIIDNADYILQSYLRDEIQEITMSDK